MNRKHSAPLALGLLAALLGAAPVRAQAPGPPPAPAWVGDVASLGANALVGGFTAGLYQKLRGGSFQDGFTRGALGGAVIYGGKRVAVQRFAGAGLVGREVAAVGASVVRNAAEGRGSLERLMLPIGPVRLYVEPGARTPLQPKLDLMTLAAAGYAAATPELEWDIASSLSAGSPVFRVEDALIRGQGGRELGASGITRAGAIYLSDLPGLDYAEDFAHERVHVLQYDQIFYTMTDPVEDWLLDRLPGGGSLSRYADLNLSPLVTSVLARGAFKNYYNRPWELEARFMVER